MSCKSAIYTVNSSNPTLAENSQIEFGSVVRRFGKGLTLDGGSILCCGDGYYDVECSITVSPSATGSVTAQLYKDGVAVPGALGTAYSTANNPIVIPITALVRNCSCGCNSTLSIRVDAACTVENCACVVEKI